MIKIDVKEVKLLIPDDIKDNVEQGIMNALMDTALFGANYAKKSIRKGPKTGHYYKRGKKMHRASSPGQTPATDTGHLIRNIYPEATSELTASMWSKASYSSDLEYGTYKMAARPFFRAAAWQAGLHFRDVLHVYIKAAGKS